MRILKFIVTGQKIEKDPNCDFNGIVEGSKCYLQAVFKFSPEWQNRKKVASFWHFGKEYAVLIQNNCCMIPNEAVVCRDFDVSVTGLEDGAFIPTNKVTVPQDRRL